MSTNYMCCDKCSTEFVAKNTNSTTLRCPDCSQWIDLDPVPAYSSRHYSKPYTDVYVDFDMDNYGYND